VLGGDCSILLGAMLALRRRGRYGLLYIDGDADFYQPEVNPLSGAASASDLAFATGRGPDVVADIEADGRWCATTTWWCSPAVTLAPGNGRPASRCRITCTLLIVTRFGVSALAPWPARP
jgi:hypothetical protein